MGDEHLQGCGTGLVRLGGAHGAPDLLRMGRSSRLMVGWTLATLGALATMLVRDRLEPWLWMWLICAAMLTGLKLVTLLRLDAVDRRSLSLGRLGGYLFLWPGLRPQPFCQPVSPSARQPVTTIWPRGLAKMTAGIAMFWLVPPLLPEASPYWLRAWCGMVGFSLFAHFGFFDVLAAFWNARGVPVEPLWDKPLTSRSLTEFWGVRWNRAFSDFSREQLLKPLARRVGVRVAPLAVFVFSGVVHELAISFPARGGYGLPLLYFLLQGLCVLTEGSSLGRDLLKRHPLAGRLWTTLMILAPTPLLFHPPFLERVVLPFMSALGVQ